MSRPYSSRPYKSGSNSSRSHSYSRGQRGREKSIPKQAQNLPSPWAVLKHSQPHPHIWRNTVAFTDPKAAPGDLVNVYDSDYEQLGLGLFAPKSNVQIRMLSHSPETAIAKVLEAKIKAAVSLRTEVLRLDENSTCYRLVHGEGDGLPGLIVDKLGEVIAIEVFTEGWFKLLPIVVEHLKSAFKDCSFIVKADRKAQETEGFRESQREFGKLPKKLTVVEHGMKFRVNLATGHKTGFFCDQRDNRVAVRGWAKDRTVLDVCTYTGGFALNAAYGGAKSVVGVDLDEKALAVAKTNAGLNQLKVKWTHADGFAYLRQMQENNRRFGVVVLDPPKFIPDKKSIELGQRKYYDLNKLGASLVEHKGLLVTCSCSGLFSRDRLLQTLQRVQHSTGIQLQLIQVTGAGADHPVQMNCLQSEYLKAAWFRVLRPESL